MKKYPYRVYFQWGGTNLSLREEHEECPSLNGKQCLVLATQNGNRCSESLCHGELIELIQGKKVEVVENTLRETVLNKELFEIISKAQEEALALAKAKALAEAQTQNGT